MTTPSSGPKAVPRPPISPYARLCTPSITSKMARLDIGGHVRVEPAAEAGEAARQGGGEQLQSVDRDAVEGGERVVGADHAEGDAETRSLQQHERGDDGGEQPINDEHELEGADIVLEDVADVAKAVDAVGPDGFAIGARCGSGTARRGCAPSRRMPGSRWRTGSRAAAASAGRRATPPPRRRRCRPRDRARAATARAPLRCRPRRRRCAKKACWPNEISPVSSSR